MLDAHAGMGIREEHFEAVIRHMEAALEEQGVGDRERRELLSKLRALRSEMLEKGQRRR